MLPVDLRDDRPERQGAIFRAKADHDFLLEEQEAPAQHRHDTHHRWSSPDPPDGQRPRRPRLRRWGRPRNTNSMRHGARAIQPLRLKLIRRLLAQRPDRISYTGPIFGRAIRLPSQRRGRGKTPGCCRAPTTGCASDPPDHQAPRLVRGQPGMDRECHQPTEVAVTHQPKHCPTSTEGRVSPLRRRNTNYLWGGWGSNPQPRAMSPLL